MESYILKKDLGEEVAKHFRNQDLISIEDLIGLIEELEGEIEYLNEEIEHIEKDKEDNYKPIDPMAMYGLSESDFH